MDSDAHLKGLTEAQLLEAAAREGVRVSRDRLKRLRMAGLVARPEQVHVKGVRGSVALYPRKAVRQLCELEPLRRERRLEHLVMLAWWQGLDVASGDARRAAVHLLDGVSRRFIKEAVQYEEAFDAAEAFAAEAASARNRSPALRLMRRRLGSVEDFVSVLTALGTVTFGAEIPWQVGETDDHERSLVELVSQGTGMDRATWLDEPLDVPKLFAELEAAGAFDAADLARPLREATEAQLLVARANARLLMVDLPVVTRMVELLEGEDAQGLGSFAAFADRDRQPDAVDRAVHVRLALLLERLLGVDRFDQLRALVAEQASIARAVGAVHAALPQHWRLVRQLVRDPDADPAGKASFLADLQALVDADADFARLVSPWI